MSATDLSALARGATTASPPPAKKTAVPSPRFRWKTRVALPGVIIAATVGLIGYAASDVLWPATPVRVVPVLVKSDAEAQPAGTVVVQAPGWVESDPFAVSVSALTNGVVAEVLVLEGERVARDQVVARLVPDDARIALDQAEAALAEERAALASAEATLVEAQRNWDHPIELRRKLDTAEAQLAEKRAELERWPAELERETAHAVYLEAEHQRLIPLHEAGQASDIELIQARQAHLSQQATVKAVRQRKPILEAQIRTLEAEVRAARDDLELRIADTRALASASAAVQRAKAAVAAATAAHADAALRLERMEVRSPTDGVVMTRQVEPGSKVMLGADNPRSAQIVRLYDPNALQVRVDIPLVDAAKVGVGQPAEVIVDVLPDHTFQGHVTRVVHEADVQKNTLQVKVAIEDPIPAIKPEMLARARFLSVPSQTAASKPEQSREAYFVPSSALMERDGESFVWLADQVDNVARRTPVKATGAKHDNWIAVDGGLKPGDRVIIDAPADLTDGDRIRLIEQ